MINTSSVRIGGEFRLAGQIVVALCLLTACHDDLYIPPDVRSAYKALTPPKILYSCTTEYPYVLACTLDGFHTAQECMEDAVRNDRLKDEVSYTHFGSDSTHGNLYSTEEMIALAQSKCLGTFEIIEKE